jgi:hypothetical protein
LRENKKVGESFLSTFSDSKDKIPKLLSLTERYPKHFTCSYLKLPRELSLQNFL